MEATISGNYAPTSIAADPKARRAPIEEVGVNLDHAVEKLHALISQLEDKLGSVLMPTPAPDSPESVPDCPGSSVLAHHLAGVLERIHQASRRVDRITSLCEL